MNVARLILRPSQTNFHECVLIREIRVIHHENFKVHVYDNYMYLTLASDHLSIPKALMPSANSSL